MSKLSSINTYADRRLLINPISVHKAFAAAMLIIIIFATIMMWPTSYLGFTSYPTTNIIKTVEPRGAADIAGIMVGDRLWRMYGQPIETINTSINIISIIRSWGQPVEITVERAGIELTFSLIRMQNTDFLLIKIILVIVSLSCWLTGYSLGVIRHHGPTSPLVSIYWMTMGGILGSLLYAEFMALPLFIFLIWILVVLVLPISVYIHMLFPLHQREAHKSKLGLRILSISILLNIMFIGWSMYQNISVAQSIDIFSRLLPFALMSSLGGSAWVLYRRYRRTAIIHTKRQIRLIAMACASIMFFCLLLLVLPRLFLGTTLIRERWLILLFTILPASYIVGNGVADLYRLEEGLRRGFTLLATTTSLLLLLVSSIRVLGLPLAQMGLWLTVAFVALYRPMQRMWLHLVPVSNTQAKQVLQLQETIDTLSRSLDLELVTCTFLEGIKPHFRDPAFALYLTDVHATLTLSTSERMPNMPTSIARGALTCMLGQIPTIIESRALPQYLGSVPPLREDEEAMMNSTSILWCVLRGNKDDILGLLVLGLRGDLDPYRERDIRILQQLIGAVSLALSNSIAYRLQVQDKEVIRDLFRQVQLAQDKTTRAIARELHDAMINDHLYISIRDLTRLIAVLPSNFVEPAQAILRNQYAFAEALRTMCDDLHPTGIDDLLHGLPTVLRKQVLKVRERWSGKVMLDVLGEPLPVASDIQYEALRIAKQAMDNTIKHAHASEIRIVLSYPDQPSEHVKLMMIDNGRNARTVEARPGHRGLYYMQESARCVGGQLCVEVKPGQSTAIIFIFPHI